jgi:hypothetical protein
MILFQETMKDIEAGLSNNLQVKNLGDLKY